MDISWLDVRLDTKHLAQCQGWRKASTVHRDWMGAMGNRATWGGAVGWGTSGRERAKQA